MSSAKTDHSGQLEKKVDAAIGLMQHLLAIELAREGVPIQTIAKHLHLAKATVVAMLKGVQKRARKET